jgi:hypothetical protein
MIQVLAIESLDRIAKGEVSKIESSCSISNFSMFRRKGHLGLRLPAVVLVGGIATNMVQPGIKPFWITQLDQMVPHSDQGFLHHIFNSISRNAVRLG